ncbi:hypothetical protein P4U99_19720 [Brevibacillus agri]|nr:hypothetical protein [Brevibacillus agri]MED1655219.1 hypothetical protein [Brevibacillus agri]MED1687215.1 hypothetical protein [Brevibacillus agri]MED1693280.1 hypothetical protein [Brevibacillus agri]MED1699470.1 hypothetical protein [Brevibacillus agri]
MYKVGVIGPHSSVERIIQLGKEYELTMTFMGYYQHEFLNKVSIDEITTSHLEQALQQIDIQPQEMYVKTFDVHSSTQELIDFHLELYKSEKTKGALACFEAVYLALTEAGVPTYRIASTDMEIRQALRILAEKIRTFYYKDTQIGVQLVELEQFEKISEKAKSFYHLQFFEMKVKETLLRYCEKLDCDCRHRGSDRDLLRGQPEGDRRADAGRIAADQPAHRRRSVRVY